MPKPYVRETFSKIEDFPDLTAMNPEELCENTWYWALWESEEECKQGKKPNFQSEYGCRSREECLEILEAFMQTE